MSYLLANGCSFTNKNFAINSGNWVHSDKEKKELGIPFDDYPMWPEYVARQMGIKDVNLAKNGASNSRMHRTTLAQVQKKRPKAIMHLWTSSGRSDYMNEEIISYDFIRAVYFAGAIMSRNPNFCDPFIDDVKGVRNFVPGQSAFKMISIYHPNEFNSIIRFYIDQFQDKPDQLRFFLDCIKVDDNSFGKKKELWTTPMIKFYVNLFYNILNYTDNELDAWNEYLLNLDLQPLLDTYYMCKAENIPFVSLSALPLDPLSVPIRDHYNKVSPPETEKLIDKCRIWKEFESSFPGYEKLNMFQKMALNIRYQTKRREQMLIKNEVFKKLDDLIGDKEMIFDHLPPVNRFNPTPAVDTFIPDYKYVSKLDFHPHHSMQEKIGAVFYDAYQKNYS